ncbi:MAG: Lrp/AsnC family transcriptional regulator [Candidatus Micrarchaeia archaeon]
MPKKILKLDSKDKKILAALEMNARAPLSAIARQAGLSKSNVLARINRMKREGFLTRFIVGLSSEALGGTFFRLYFSFQNTPEGFERGLVDLAYQIPSVRWFAFFNGRWDFAIRVAAEDEYEFKKVEKQIMDSIGKYVKDRSFCLNINSAIHYYTYITGNEGPVAPRSEYDGTKISGLHETDRQLLYHLNEDCRISATGIGKKIGIAPESVSYRIKKLREKGVINGFTIRLDRNRIGSVEAKILISFNYGQEKEEERLLKFCDRHSHLMYYSRILGGWDMEIDMDAADPATLYHQVKEIKRAFPGLIKDYNVLIKIAEFEPNQLAKLAGIKPKAPAIPNIVEF